MIKYDIKTAQAYINGEDIESYTLDELENNKDFMMMVIRTTHDKKMYSFCSDEVKTNHEFVKYLIYEFKNDLNFICEVVDNFFDAKGDTKEAFELSIIMYDILKRKDDDRFLIYGLKANARYIYEMSEIQLYIDKSNDENNIGMGFIVVYDEYKDSKIILDYFAKKMVVNLFEDNKIKLEELIHKNFRTKKSFEDVGISNFLINFIRYYDDMLSDYLASNIYLLSDYIKEEKKIKYNFDNYNNKLESEKIDIILERIDEYFKEINASYYLSETFLTYYVAKKLGVLELLINNSLISKESIMSALSCYSDYEISEILQNSFIDMANFKSVEKIFKEVLFNKDFVEEDSYTKKEANETIIIDFNKGKK